MSRPGHRAPGASTNTDAVLRYMRDMNASMANLQASVDGLRNDMNKKAEAEMAKRDDANNALTARIGTVGNQVSYFRQTVCDNLKSMVSELMKW